MTDQIRWGIAGPGRMAAEIVPEFRLAGNAELVAVGSRSAERAEVFATEHGIPRWHSSYESLVTDPAVQAVYIATPHPQHTDIALAAIAAGKAVLVEKAFTATLADTERIAAAARESGVFAMEAMWTRFNPALAHLREIIAADEIGEIRGCQGDLTAFRAFDAEDRLFDPAKGGGAVLDLGVYVLSFAQHFLGTPDVVRAVGGRYPTGVEGEFSVLLGYADGRSATLAGAFTAYGPGRMMLTGTKGWIDVHPRFHRAASVTIWRGKTPETLEFDSGYRYEIEHVGDCLADGLTESPIMPLDDTIAVQRIMAEVLDQI
ncbi:MAG: Gfo/Idh/MocA family oxidoreductase [Micropruina sp.]|uniref:Gfo/Idh/MocA family protein n=1 Tax=Micropruina sp. TaxID=2737536 RepID=UPI0039E2BB46